MKVKKKRYYIDRTEGDILIFITTGRKNKMVRSPVMREAVVRENKENSTVYTFEPKTFQPEHSLNGWNSRYLEAQGRDIKECGIDTKYRFFWRRCVKSCGNPHRHTYDKLFRMLKNQKN